MSRPTTVLGISAFYHDSAAALLVDGELVAAAQEERFTRVKHDASFPENAIEWCLHSAGVERDGIDAIVFYEKPLTTFVRLLRTYLKVGPRGFASFRQAIPLWLREKLWIPYEIDKGIESLGYGRAGDRWFVEHHESHAASAFYPSPFESAAILTFDGVGEWATSSIGRGAGNEVRLLEEIDFPHSLGMLYSAFTYFCGFRVNSGEYKLMGLAPYGEPRYAETIKQHLIDLHDDGSFTLDLSYFDYLAGLTMTNDRFAALFDGPPRSPESDITRREMDLAASIQQVTEEAVLAMARRARAITGESKACLAGGVALNCVANGVLLREGVFDEIWLQPAAGDAGGAVGAAYLGWHRLMDRPRTVDPRGRDAMHGAYLGPEFASDEIGAWLNEASLPHHTLQGAARAERIAAEIDEGRVVGMFQGPMEFGPRALGHRSIIGDPRSTDMQSTMNLKIKYRESFRPFAPAVLAEQVDDWFELEGESPYMLLVAPVAHERVDTATLRRSRDSDDLRSWVNERRSDIPAVTHVDGSARVQTVSASTSPRFREILEAFEARTGCGVLINTSFNVRGEPIVCTPDDAYRCFMRTEMDVLVLENHVLVKDEQPEWTEPDDWRDEFVLD
ncbi:MAG: carbamoyltransferase [Acidimicrobiales bacterium]|jgi:carbamoyltransferase|nr:carbamoyltransferase [Acidimicrobiales bacterium]